jgi:hypothetical protein
MDPITILALVLFFAMVVAWFALPGIAATGVTEQDEKAVGLTTAHQQA